MDRFKFRRLPYHSSWSHHLDVLIVSKSIFGRAIVGTVVIWWSCLYVCIADGFNFNQSGPALDGDEELETASLCWKSLGMDGILIYIFKTCEGGTFLVLSSLPGLHVTHDSNSIC